MASFIYFWSGLQPVIFREKQRCVLTLVAYSLLRQNGRKQPGRIGGVQTEQMQVNIFDGVYNTGWSRFTFVALLDVLKVVTTVWSLRSADSKGSNVTQKLVLFCDMITSGLLITADGLWAAAITTALRADFAGFSANEFRVYENLGGGMRIFMPRKALRGNPNAPVWSRPDNLNDLVILANLNTAMRVYHSLHLSSLVVRVCKRNPLMRAT